MRPRLGGEGVMSCDDCYGAGAYAETIELADRLDDLEEQVKALEQRLLDVETPEEPWT